MSMACILSLARFTAPNRPSKHERVYASSPPPFHININGPSSNYIPKRPRANNRLNMTTFFSIASVPQLQPIQVEVEDDSKQMLTERIGKYLDSLLLGGGLQVDSIDEALGIADLIQRLGIQRFFQQQIHRILDSIYSKWDEKFGLTHGNLAILGFLLLGFHGYHVTSGLAVAAATATNIDHDNEYDNDSETNINNINIRNKNNNDNENDNATSTSTTSTSSSTTSTTTTSATTEEPENDNKKSLFVTHVSQPYVSRLIN